MAVDVSRTVHHIAWMSRTYPPILSLVMLFGLAACGQHLGDYKFEDASLVEQVSLARGPDRPSQRLPYPRFLRVEISSPTNLSTADYGGDLYTEADFCPLKNPYSIIAFTPQAKDGLAIQNWKRPAPMEPDEGDGLYHYFIYIVPSAPARNIFSNSEHDMESYDIFSEGRPICFRLFVPGYNITPSRSNVMEIPADAILQAQSKPGP